MVQVELGPVFGVQLEDGTLDAAQPGFGAALGIHAEEGAPSPIHAVVVFPCCTQLMKSRVSVAAKPVTTYEPAAALRNVGNEAGLPVIEYEVTAALKTKLTVAGFTLTAYEAVTAGRRTAKITGFPVSANVPSEPRRLVLNRAAFPVTV
ncbi:hypothetical protein AYJ54_00735 [Bradyrhizobium centrolobii]|uniref:Uncharacterized protein n=1 Tax=Bradyrhizobium centrolobii TaxID=1505087 RepID=A0A176YFQ5_9BRAD|nr:hypothetical protein AYJ54_00735 [Bradyrhizobium centrolobii]